MAVVLQLSNGAQRSFGSAFLASLLSTLLASGQAVCDDQGVFVMNAQIGLLLVDGSWSFGRRIAEQFEIVSRPANPFGLGFVSGAQTLDLDEALAAVGYPGALPVPSLGAVFMAWYQGPNGAYVESTGSGSSLVADEGTFSLAPAQLKSLTVGAGLAIVSAADALTVSCPTLSDKLNRSGDLVLTLSSSNPSVPPALVLATPAASWTVGPTPAGSLAFQQGLTFENRLVLSSAGASVNGQLAVLDNDARLTNARTPADGSVTDASVSPSAAIQQSKIQNLVSDLAARVLNTDGRLSDARAPTDNSVSTVKLQDGAVTSAKLATHAVTNLAVADGALAQAKVTGLTSDLAARVPLTGGTMTGALTVQADINANVSRPGGGNTVLGVTNPAADGFASLYATSNGGNEQAQLFVGQGGGLFLRTNTNHPITLMTNSGAGGNPSLVLNANRSVSIPGSLQVGGQAVVVNNDARLSDARAPTAGSVVDASVSPTAAIAQSKISGLTTALAALAPINNPSFTTGITTPLVTLPSADANKLLLTNSATASRIATSPFWGVDFYAGPGNVNNGYYRFFAGTASGHSERLRVDIDGAQVFGTLSVSGATTFTGVPSGPTATVGTSTGQLATTAFVQSAAALRLPLTGGTLTGALTVQADINANISRAGGGNTVVGVTNPAADGFASTFMTTNGGAEQAQLFVGQNGGLTLATNTNHPITLSVNRFSGSSSMVLGTNRNVSVTNSLSVGGTITAQQHHVTAFFTGTGQVLSSGLVHQLNFNGTAHVRGTNAYDTVSRTFTVPATGLYLVTATLVSDAMLPGSGWQITFQRDLLNAPVATSKREPSLTAVLALTAGSFFALYATHTQGSNVTLEGGAADLTRCTLTMLC